jgi:hypothetical protein
MATDPGMVATITQSLWNQLQMEAVILKLAAAASILMTVFLAWAFIGAWPYFRQKFAGVVGNKSETMVLMMDHRTKHIAANSKFSKENGKICHDGKPDDFIKVYPGNYYFAAVPFDLMIGDEGTLTGYSYMNLCAMMKQYGYPEIESLERALLFSQRVPSKEDWTDDNPYVERIKRMEGYQTYEEAQKCINPRNLTADHAVINELFTSIELSELLGYASEIPPDSIDGEVDDQYQQRKPQEKWKRETTKMIPYLAVALIVCALAAVGYKIFFSTH